MSRAARGVPDPARAAPRVGRRRPWVWIWAVLLVMTLLAPLLMLGAFVWAVDLMGQTPLRVLDHVEDRLRYRPNVEKVAGPMVKVTRAVLDAHAPPEHALPFKAPPPPAPWPAARTRPPVVPAGATVWRVGPSGPLRTVAEAARQARDGDVVEIEAGEYFGDVAVWMQRRLTIRGVGGQARLHANGRSAEGKAIWVIRNGDFLVENIDFIGARVYDRNGAGIRFENGHLVVRHCLFWNSESGILTSSGPNHRQARLEVYDSEFGYLGDGEGRSHAVYAGDISFLRVVGSHFHHGNVGHLIKSRARVNDIRYNRLTDETGGRASYELELPNGGVAVVVGNQVQQSRTTSNAALVSYGAEGYIWPDNRLFLVGNTLVNDLPDGGAFLRVHPGPAQVLSMNNLLLGRGRMVGPDPVESVNDLRGDWTLVQRAAVHDYTPTSKVRGQGWTDPPVAQVEGLPLRPTHRYVHPRQRVPLTAPPAHPGAVP